MRYVVLYRHCNHPDDDKAEVEALQSAGFVYLTNRAKIQKNDLVICRYSAVPFYKELCQDLEDINATPINSFYQHQYICDLQNYVADLKELTPETWSRLEDLPEDCAFVLKGETNSKKSDWKNSMFASNKKEAIEVYNRLSEDSLIGQQQIYIRKYVPLVTYMTGFRGMPITKEFRFFVYKGTIIVGDYYWSSHLDQLEQVPSVEEVPVSLLEEVIRRVKDKIDTFVVDVAQDVDGNWLVVELNSFQQSGLSTIDPKVLYQKLMENIVELENKKNVFKPILEFEDAKFGKGVHVIIDTSGIALQDSYKFYDLVDAFQKLNPAFPDLQYEHHPYYGSSIHYKFIEEEMKSWNEEQKFITTNNPFVFDNLTFSSVEDAQSRFLIIKNERLTNISQDQAERFYTAYITGIESVSQILRSEGIW